MHKMKSQTKSPVFPITDFTWEPNPFFQKTDADTYRGRLTYRHFLMKADIPDSFFIEGKTKSIYFGWPRYHARIGGPVTSEVYLYYEGGREYQVFLYAEATDET